MADEKYRTQLTGAQVDDALQQLNQRVAEGWAVGTRDGSPVGSGSEYYHNNAKYWADQSHSSVDAAEAAAARAEAAVPAGTAGAVFFDRAQALNDTQKGQARQNIGAANTNPNLLDNGWFLVNSRGQNSYSGYGYTFDRWKSYSSTSVSKSGDIVTMTANGHLNYFQPLGTKLASDLANKTVTFSAKVNDDSVVSVSGIFPSSLTTTMATLGTLTIDGYVITIGFASANSGTQITVPTLWLYGNAGAETITVKAFKLELGSVSTLANDTPPNYGEELTKCIYSAADPADLYANNGVGRSNRNLLDNWYFAGGGTTGNFPINQRGSATYTAAAYAIDRWFLGNGAGTLTFSANYMTFAASTSNAYLRQKLQTPLTGTYTLSARVSGTGRCRLLFNDASFNNLSSQTFDITGETIVSVTFATTGTPIAGVSLRTDAGNTVNFHSAKLEIGTVSTLANDAPPDYGTELAKCQRYFVRLTAPAYGNGFGIGRAYSAYDCRVFFPLPVSLRTSPTVSATSLGNCSLSGGGNSFSVTSVSYSGRSENGVSLSFAASGLTPNELYMVYKSGNDNTYIDISADL